VPEGAVVLVPQPPSAAPTVRTAVVTAIKVVLVRVVMGVLLCIQVG
jgi:hypothetical protein